MANAWCQGLNRIHASRPLLDQCAPLSQRHRPDIRWSCLLSKVQEKCTKAEASTDNTLVCSLPGFLLCTVTSNHLLPHYKTP